jgi:hypothetical protein
VAGSPPYFVDREMVEALSADVSGIVEIMPGSAAATAGTSDMIFAEGEQDAAALLPNAETHREIAHALSSVIAPISAGHATWASSRPARYVSRSQAF